MRSLKIKRFVKKKKSPRRRKKKSTKIVLTAAKLARWSFKVRRRGFFTCFSCGKKKNLHAHHMVSKYYKPQYAYLLTNGVTLCRKCHIGAGGVHCKKDLPKNKVIFKLREIYLSHDINKAKKIGKNLLDTYSNRRRILAERKSS